MERESGTDGRLFVASKDCNRSCNPVGRWYIDSGSSVLVFSSSGCGKDDIASALGGSGVSIEGFLADVA